MADQKPQDPTGQQINESAAVSDYGVLGAASKLTANGQSRATEANRGKS